MDQLRVFFIKGDITNPIDDLIEIFSKGQYVHVAIEILGGTLESLSPDGVRLSPAGIYDNCDGVLIKVVDVPDLARAEAVAQSLIGKPYGYSSCVSGGLHDQLGINTPDTKGIIDDCSETVIRILRGGGVDLLQGIAPNDVTPMDLLNAMK